MGAKPFIRARAALVIGGITTVSIAMIAVRMVIFYANASFSAPQNLIIAYAEYAPMPGYAWEPVSFTAYVKNSGAGNAGMSRVRLRVDAKGDGTWETVSSVPLGVLETGVLRGVMWPNAVTLPPGMHMAEICADADDAAAESDESDNCRSLSFSIANWYGALSGPDRMLDIVFIGDRYPDMSPFYNDVAGLKDYLLSLAPFTEFASQIRFHIVENATYLGCRETTVDLYAPIDPPPTKPTGTSTTIMCDQSLVVKAVKQAGISYDKIVVLASGMNGGTGFGSFVFTGKEKRLFVHELGHGFGLLDEYVSASNAGPASDACHANCCENLRCAAWDGIPGAQCVLGCTYSNWYRSSPESIMKSHYTAEYFNAVSVDHLKKTIARYIEQVPPTVAILAPNNAEIVRGSVAVRIAASDDTLISKMELMIDGKLLAKQYAEQSKVAHYVAWDTMPLLPGSTHVLEAKAYDLAGNVAISVPVTVTIAAASVPISTPTSAPIPVAQTTQPYPVPIATVSPEPLPSATPKTIAPSVPGMQNDDLIIGDGYLYLVKAVGAKTFIRRVVLFSSLRLYPHLANRMSTAVSGISAYKRSAWIRLPVTPVPETWKIWEVNDDGTKHWITCADPNYCAETWVKNGGDSDGIYTVNKQELDLYRTGSNVFLR